MCLPLMKAFLQELATGGATNRTDANTKNQLTGSSFSQRIDGIDIALGFMDFRAGLN